MNLYNKYILPKILDFSMKKKEMEVLRKSAVSKARGEVLEIGFGSGLNISYYKEVNKLYALEPSQEIFDIGKKNIANAKFIVEYLKNSAENIPLANNSIDSVVSTWSLCSIPNPENALKEIHRVLKPEGKFYFLEHGKSNKSFKYKLQNIVNPFSKCCMGGCNLNRDIEKLVTDSGFEIENIEKFELKSKPLAFVYRGFAK